VLDTATTPATSLTLGQAAKLTGLGKTTLSRAIKAGRLSATRSATGGYNIDAAELARVYQFPAPTADQDATGTVAHHATPNATSEALAVEVAGLREMLAMMREQVAELRDDRDQWRDQAQRLALAPPKPAQQPDVTPTAQPAEPPSRLRRAWRWMRATG
jgi:excisionase family DNA binding protein